MPVDEARVSLVDAAIRQRLVAMGFRLLRRTRDLLAADGRRRQLYYDLCAAYLKAYTAYHEKRKSPGRVYEIPGRDCKMWLPISWGKTVVQRRFGLFEPWTFETLRTVVEPGMRVVELGACYGEFTIQLSRLVGAEGRVYSFEPFPKYFAILKRNVELNNLRNVILFNQAAGEGSIGEVSFDSEAIHPYASLDQISGLDYSARGGSLDPQTRPTTKVPTVRLKSFLEQEGIEMDLLFMDIEGCEIPVLKDLEEILCSQRKPVIYLETHEMFYRPGDFDWMRTLLERSGYSTKTIDQRHLLCLP